MRQQMRKREINKEPMTSHIDLILRHLLQTAKYILLLTGTWNIHVCMFTTKSYESVYFNLHDKRKKKILNAHQ